jgi:hypothetical protein
MEFLFPLIGLALACIGWNTCMPWGQDRSRPNVPNVRDVREREMANDSALAYLAGWEDERQPVWDEHRHSVRNAQVARTWRMNLSRNDAAAAYERRMRDRRQ